MNQTDLINAISEHHSNTGVSKAAIKFVLEAQGEVIQKAMRVGDEVTIPDLGKLTVAAKAARKGRNPATGEEIDIPAKRVPKFSAAKALKDAVNG